MDLLLQRVIEFFLIELENLIDLIHLPVHFLDVFLGELDLDLLHRHVAAFDLETRDRFVAFCNDLQDFILADPRRFPADLDDRGEGPLYRLDSHVVEHLLFEVGGLGEAFVVVTDFGPE